MNAQNQEVGRLGVTLLAQLEGAPLPVARAALKMALERLESIARIDIYSPAFEQLERQYDADADPSLSGVAYEVPRAPARPDVEPEESACDTMRMIRRVDSHRRIRVLHSRYQLPVDCCAPGDRVSIAFPVPRQTRLTVTVIERDLEVVAQLVNS